MASALNLGSVIKTVSILNVDQENSTINANQLILNERIEDRSYILSDVDEELLILVEFESIVNLDLIQLFAFQHIDINDENDINIDSSQPKQIHIHKLENLNTNFDDISSIKAQKSIKCSSKKLEKGQNINLTKKISFKKTKYIAIYIVSNQNETESTHLHGIRFMNKDSNYNHIVFDRTDIKNRNKLKEITATFNDHIGDNVVISKQYLLSSIPYDHDIVNNLVSLGIASRDKCIKASSMTDDYTNKSKVFIALQRMLDDEKRGDQRRFDEDVVNNLVKMGLSTRDQCIRASELSDNYKDANVVFEKLEEILSKQEENNKCDDNLTISNDIKSCNLSTCKYLERLIVVLSEYHNFIAYHDENESKNNIDNIFNDEWNNRTIINDFHHLLNIHGNQFEDIYDILVERCNNGKLCSLSECCLIRRHYRDRNKYRNNDIELRKLYFNCNDNEDIIHQQIMDVIHCHYFHSFDTRCKLSTQQKEKIREMMKGNESKENRETLSTDNASKFIYNFISTQSESTDFENIATRFSQNIGIAEDKYSFGIKYFYWNYYENNRNMIDTSQINMNEKDLSAANKNHSLADFYINAKYKNLKEELLNNKICVIGENQWNNLLKKAVVHQQSDYFAGMTSNFTAERNIYDTGQENTQRNPFWSPEYRRGILKQCVPAIKHRIYGIIENTPISASHIVAMMVYCNMDTLQQKFSETYRRIPENENDERIIQRHRNYAHLGRLLREIIEIYGPIACDKKTWKLYHGISRKTQFSSVYTRFNGPLSTTSEYVVAVNFAGNKGLILQLKCQQSMWLRGMFECQCLSDYPNEEEIFFIGGYGIFQFETIIEAPKGKNYELYIAALTTLIKAVQNERFLTINTKRDKIIQQIGYRILLHELHRHYPNNEEYPPFKSLPLYVRRLVKNQFANIEMLSIGSHAIRTFRYENPTYLHRKEVAYFEEIFRCLFFYDNGWIKLDEVTTLFPFIKDISLGDREQNAKFAINESVYLSVLELLTKRSNLKLRTVKFQILNSIKSNVESIMLKFRNKFKEFKWSLNFEAPWNYDSNTTPYSEVVMKPFNVISQTIEQKLTQKG